MYTVRHYRIVNRDSETKEFISSMYMHVVTKSSLLPNNLIEFISTFRQVSCDVVSVCAVIYLT